MKSVREQISELGATLDVYRDYVKRLEKYKSNTFYVSKEKKIRLQLNRQIRFLSDSVLKTKNKKLKDTWAQIKAIIEPLTEDLKLVERISRAHESERAWPDLEIACAGLVDTTSDRHDIPSEIPKGEVREDLEEASKAFSSELFHSCIAMSRKAYEGALEEKYESITGKPPVEDFNCPSCRKKIIKSKPIGVTKLHKWAIEEGIISDKFRHIGFLVPGLGAGATHPSKGVFPRDLYVARTSLLLACSLIKRLSGSSQLA